ncbi:hypothetical protein J1N44_14665 [Acidovorax temperans]|nr:hypothetical protein [Acidovorax temperans]
MPLAPRSMPNGGAFSSTAATVVNGRVRHATATRPPRLRASSWSRMMKGLDQHYGTDASLDPAMVRQISVWLEAHAGTFKRVREAPPQDRITQSAWFERKHRDIEPAVWKRASIGSRANCMACHLRADQGDFDDDRVRIPK